MPSLEKREESLAPALPPSETRPETKPSPIKERNKEQERQDAWRRRTTTAEQYQKNLKPVWIKDSAPQTQSDAYLWEHTASLINNQDPALFRDIPERPYLLLFKPTQAPEARTTNKTLTQQQTEFNQINQERQANGRSPAGVIKPVEYAAAQKLFTERVKNQSSQPLTNLRPLDSATWSRFIDLPLSAGGGVPGGDFYPVYRRLKFDRGDADDPDPRSGFRLSVRVEL